ncbi:glutamate--tRNA ligase family protein [Candidatus Shikimatogenerans bostrichidophilus]|uniref:glutamate--tRNA ligase family protein n=1 Tax=Candidatus Shikimatogenerans bostrichidophilus TaxID=2943807 RepID=UPI002966F173
MNNFITNIIDNDIKNGLSIKNIKFRFPPEPNGFLHLGHIKSLYINFTLAKKYNSKIYLRFEDTNPNNINIKYINQIIKNIKWLGFKYNKITYISNYFNLLYKWAKILIIKQKAYIQKIYNNKIYNINDIDKNLFIFKNMKNGKYKENSYILRAKINNNSPNFYLNDPIMYRIINKKHLFTKDKWCIYPTYDWAHGQSDYIEKISHSLCSIEFQNHKPLYEWFINQIYNKNFNSIKPKQIEFSRLNLSQTITSKRQINILKNKKIISNFCDPRLCTITSFKKKGYNSKYIINFIKKLGYTKRNNNINIKTLELYIKNKIINKSPKLLVIINPIKLTIINIPKYYIEWIYIYNKKNYPKYKVIPFTKTIYIDKNDFKDYYDKNFFRLSFNNYVRLKYSYIIKIFKIVKNNNNIKKIYCKIYNYNTIKNNKIKSTIQWVSCKYYTKINIILYNYIYFKNKNIINKNSLKYISVYGDISINNINLYNIYQFHRIGFFYFFKIINNIFYFKKLFFLNP